MTFFERYLPPRDGFAVVAGRQHGLHRLVLAAGSLPPGAGGPPHLHHGEEVLRILSGECDVTVGGERRRCAAGEVVVIPTDVVHGFTTVADTEMEVIAELDAGQIFPVATGDGETELIEVYRADMPWSRRPPHGFDWTSDHQMQQILNRIGGVSS